MKYIIFFILICIALHFIRKFVNKFKFPNISCLAVFTGGVKVGKSAVSLACALSKYRSVHRSWSIQCFFCKLFKKPLPEEPLFYSNIPLAGVKYHDLTLGHILRKVKLGSKAVTFVDEASLLCDCYLSKSDPDLSTKLLLFFKLYGHETHSGYCVFNSQSISDLHIALRKCTNQTFYIYSTSSSFFIPFFAWCRMREERYCEDGTAINTYATDIEDTMKTCIFRKKVFKMYDSHSYSIMTDNLDTLDIPHFNSYKDSLKAHHLVSFRKEFVNEFNKSIKGVTYEKTKD